MHGVRFKESVPPRHGGLVASGKEGNDGLTTAGRPYSVEVNDVDKDLEGIGTLFPIGETKFTVDFAESVEHKIIGATAKAQVGQPGETGGERSAAPLRGGKKASVDVQVARSFAGINSISEWELEQRSEQLALPKMEREWD